MRVSSSMLSKWMTCPLQAKFHYIDKLPSRKTSHMVFGNCVHVALEHYNHHGDVDKAVEMFKDVWDNPDKIGLKIEVWPGRISAGAFREKGIRLITEADIRIKREGRIVVATEHGFKVPIGDHEITGYVDLLEVRKSGRGKNVLRIVDYKTGSKQPYQDNLRNNIQFCADAETEILTRRGWKLYNDVVAGEDVLTLNQASGLAEWQPALTINVFDCIEQDLLSMEGKAHSSLTTMNHRWPVNRRITSRSQPSRTISKVVTSAELTGQDQIICAAPVANLPTVEKYTSDFVELAAWFWTEGWLIPSGESVSIALGQSRDVNPEHADRIEGCLRELYGDPLDNIRYKMEPCWRLEHNDRDGMDRYFLNRAASQEVLAVFVDKGSKQVDPSFLTSLTAWQLELFYEVSMMADGHRSPHGEIAITQSQKSRLDSFQVVISLLGWRSSLRYRPVGMNSKAYPGRPSWHLSVKNRRPNFVPSAKYRKVVKYTGKVWCPTTHNKTWLARRDGQVYFTGNTIYDYASRQPEFWLGWPGDPEFTGMPNGGEMWDKYRDFPRRGIYWYLAGDKELDVGERNEADHKRLYRVIDEVDRAIRNEVFVPNISGESCGFCDYTEPCGITIPDSQERMSGMEWF